MGDSPGSPEEMEPARKSDLSLHWDRLGLRLNPAVSGSKLVAGNALGKHFLL